MDPTLKSLKDQIRSRESEKCPLCEGMGMRVLEDEAGKRYATRCECAYALRALRSIERANLPTRHEACTFENYTSMPGGNRSLGMAAARLREYVKNWALNQNGMGLLITGDVGTGKTHLAVATLRELITQYNAVGLFCDHRSLLKAIQHSYSQRTVESESDVLAPVFKADVLVLDELGRENRSDWTGEMIEHILNTRYNDRRTTIITTNYPNLPPSGMVPVDTPKQQAAAATREVTLGDRVGERIYSRVQEMCMTVEMYGEDFRQKVKRASFV